MEKRERKQMSRVDTRVNTQPRHVFIFDEPPYKDPVPLGLLNSACVNALMPSLSSFSSLLCFPIFFFCLLLHHLAPPTISSFSPPHPPLFLSLSVPHAQPGGSALMHHGTFCSSESQCDQALRSDRTATSLGITAHRRCAVPGPV